MLRTVGRWGDFCRLRSAGPLAVLLALAGCGAAGSALPAPVPERESPVPPDFTAMIDDLRSEWSIPGVAVAVVEGDETTFLGTYGVRERGGSAPVTENTLFGIASITKVLVAGGLAVLVDAGKLDWDDRVVEHLPEFRLADPYVTANVTIRDLLAHRSGIASYGDWLEEIPGLSGAAALERMAYLDQSMRFRYGTEYSSYSFIILAEVIRRVTGKPWGEFLDEAVWSPLGMSHTYAHADDFIAAENVLPTGDGWSETIRMGQAAAGTGIDVATPHVKWETFIDPALIFEQRELAFDVSHFHRTAIDPGQGAYTSVSDLARWARVLLNDGRSGNVTLLSPETVQGMRRLQGAAGKGRWPLDARDGCGSADADLREVGIALGLFVFEYCGHVLYGHSGGELGYEGLMLIDPGEEFAVIALVNNTRSWGAVHAIVQTVLDWRYGYPDHSWPAQYRKQAIADAREAFAWMSSEAEARPAAALAEDDASEYTGAYRNPFAGALEIRQREGMLAATTGESYVLELTPLGDDAFRAIPVSPIRYWLSIEFARDDAGAVSGVSVFHPYFHQPLRFSRVPDGQREARPSR